LFYQQYKNLLEIGRIDVILQTRKEHRGEDMGRKKIKMLVVDDSKATREIVAHNLRRKGFVVFTAMSGEEALPIIIGQKPGIMLVNAKLPGISGTELVKLVRQFNKTLKVIGLVRKPIDIPELGSVIGKVVDLVKGEKK
jgi:response regulator RpfG family c-di-GMP phosphodiesterase